MKIVIVEDTEDSREYLLALLEAKGHEVKAAINGLEALGILEDEQLPDLIISDLLMPEVDGFVLLSKVRSSPRLAHIPFIVYTATYTDQKDQQLVMKLGANRFLVKPMEPTLLMEEIYATIRDCEQAQSNRPAGTELPNEYSAVLAKKLDKKVRELQLAQKTKNNFLTIMCHEIRTPLNGIIGPCSLLQMQDQSPETKELLKLIETSSYDLLHVFEEIMHVVELQQEEVKLRPSRFLLEDLFTNLQHLFLSSAERKNLKLTLQRTSPLPEYLIGDQMRLQQILSNLISNAIKFTEKGEVKLIVGLERQEKELADLRFEVIDTGRGIPEDELGKIFELFEVGANMETRNFRGIGLGLGITMSLVELMEGSLKVESQLGRGSHFTLDLSFPLASDKPVPSGLD